MVEHELGGTFCSNAKFRTPTTIIIFKLVTKPNTVEFAFMDSKLAEMAPARVARRQLVRPMVKCDNSSWKATSSTLSQSTGKSDCSLVPIFSTEVTDSGSFASRHSNCHGRDGVYRHHTYLYARAQTHFSRAHITVHNSLIDPHSSNVVTSAMAQGTRDQCRTFLKTIVISSSCL